MSASGKKRPAREVGPNLCKQCPFGCSSWSDAQRRDAFDHYWDLGDFARQRDWLAAHVRKTHVIRKRTKACSSRRKATYQYHMERDGARIQVCKRFFLSTLGIGERVVYYTLENSRHGTARGDERGHRTPANKTPSDTLAFVREHIESLPAVSSHYCRKDTTRLYLEEKLASVRNVYRLYVEECERCRPGQKPVSLPTYRRIFTKEYRLSFHKPKKDKCVNCEGFKNTPEHLRDDALRGAQDAHLQEKQATYAEHKADQTKAGQQPDFTCASFDLEKVLNTPHGNNCLLFYSRKYAVYNLTVYESHTRNGYCNLWGECDAMRGANEVGTCVYHWLVKVATQPKPPNRHIVMYCDCC